MANTSDPRWHGDDYQSRVFWEHALNLFVPDSNVAEVTFEADGPKAFDDVVVRYEPAIAGTGPSQISIDYHQVKWHTDSGGRYGYEDLIDPAFIGAKTVSLLERLVAAKSVAPVGARFSLITTCGLKDGDQLGELVSKYDSSLLISKLKDGKTDKSRMGAVRKLWREHLGLSDNDALYEKVQGLRLFSNHRSLDELRLSVNDRARVVGMRAGPASESAFHFDDLARKLKTRKLNKITRETLEKLCEQEDLWDPTYQRGLQPKAFTTVAIKSFLRLACDQQGASQENTLLLVDHFQGRYLRDVDGWQRDIHPLVVEFLQARAAKAPVIRLVLDAHVSIAYLSGSILDVKSGVTMELLQHGRVGSRLWRPDDSSERGAPMFVPPYEHACRSGRDIAVCIEATQPVVGEAVKYLDANKVGYGRVLRFRFENGPGQQTVRGGAHAVALAEQVVSAVQAARGQDRDAGVHVFAACPNALLVYLGQQHRSLACVTMYEYDFDLQGNRTYLPTFHVK